MIGARSWTYATLKKLRSNIPYQQSITAFTLSLQPHQHTRIYKKPQAKGHIPYWLNG